MNLYYIMHKIKHLDVSDKVKQELERIVNLKFNINLDIAFRTCCKQNKFDIAKWLIEQKQESKNRKKVLDIDKLCVDFDIHASDKEAFKMEIPRW